MSEDSTDEFMIEANGLSKYYGDFIAVEDLTFSIRKGEVVAFLGPNGAGKSTTMKMLTGYLAPSSGTAKVVVWKWPTTAL
jgi:ABC-2 type transport system ATP-binding protein